MPSPWAHANAVLWAVGNGLVTTSLVTYLATELGAQGLVVSLILAAPTMVGLLRQAAPAGIAWFGSRKRFCLTAYGASALTLLLLPMLAAPGVLPHARWSLAALVCLWCAYQVLEYLATVALWSWLGDLAPTHVRGAFLGQREAWLSVGRLVGMVSSGLWAFAWPLWMSRETLWLAYSLSGAAGAAVMGSALIPLGRMPACEPTIALCAVHWPDLRERLLAPWRDASFRWLMVYGAWLGAVNGLLQASQFLYGRNVLLLSLLIVLALRSGTELGQTAVSAAVGRWIDRAGNLRVMIAAQLLVGLAPWFYLLATKERWWLVSGAWILFIAYAGLNIGIPNLALKLAPQSSRTAFLASYYAWAGLAYGVGSLTGGILFDAAAAWTVDRYAVFFVGGWILRSAGVLWLARVRESAAA